MLYLYCLLDVIWVLSFFASSSRCHGLVCGVILAFPGHTVKPVLRGHSKERLQKRVFNTDCSSKVWQNDPAILLACTNLALVFKTFVLSIFEWPLKTELVALLFFGCHVGVTVLCLFIAVPYLG